MLRRKIVALAFAAAIFSLLTTAVHARSVRVDSGDDWTELDPSAVAALGFDFTMFGITADTATMSGEGQVVLSGGGAETITLNPFFEPGQTMGVTSSQFVWSITTPLFMETGVDAGFRVQWSVFNTDGLQNEYQVALFALANGQFALEFNYDQLFFGDDDSQIGWSTTTGESYDLLAALGLEFFSDYAGLGDFDPNFPEECLNAEPAALPCNNYFANTDSFGSDTSVLPEEPGGFFQVNNPSAGEDVQGRYLWIFGDADPTDVPEPTTLALIALGLLGFSSALRRSE